tara:strand:- start:570 stop:1343 length:774 start_codon:yes stop_codon:yes gene_type:complete
MKISFSQMSFLFFGVLILLGCSYPNEIILEKDHPAFERGKSLLKVGKNEDALDEFLTVTRRVIECPQSHLECGRLLLSINARKDPIAAIYHFRRYLLLEPNSRESSKVEQLIITAEREILRKLPGEPYGDYLDFLKIKEENDLLKRELADLRVRMGTAPTESLLSSDSVPNSKKREPLTPSIPLNQASAQSASTVAPKTNQTYVVQSGDSLYAISRKFYGDSSFIDLIFEANRDVMPSKNSLNVGQELRIPPKPVNR